MPEGNKTDFSKEIKPLVKGVGEALLELRTLLVALVAFVIIAIEKIAQVVSAWRSRAKEPRAKESKALVKESPVESKESLGRIKESKSRVDESPKTAVNGFRGIKKQSIEVSQSTSNPDDQALSALGLAKDYAYPALALISTIALVVGVGRLGPVSDWSRKQNECVENTTTPDREGKSGLPIKVMICNGGHE